MKKGIQRWLRDQSCEDQGGGITQASESPGPEAGCVPPGERTISVLKAKLVRQLCLQGVKMESAIAIGQEIIKDLVQKWGGEGVYIPKKRASVIHARKASICTAFKDGATRRELAERHGLSVAGVCGVLGQADNMTRMTPGDEFLACLETQISVRIFADGVSEKTAEAIGKKVVDQLAHHFNSVIFYIPQMASEAHNDRHAQIFKEFMSGSTHRELAAKYHLSVRQIYSNLRKVRIQRQYAANKLGRPPKLR